MTQTHRSKQEELAKWKTTLSDLQGQERELVSLELKRGPGPQTINPFKARLGLSGYYQLGDMKLYVQQKIRDVQSILRSLEREPETPQPVVTDPAEPAVEDQLPTKKRKRRYHSERELARDHIRRARKEYPNASKKWIIKNRLRKYVLVPRGKKRGKPFSDNTYYEWFKDEPGDKPLK